MKLFLHLTFFCLIFTETVLAQKTNSKAADTYLNPVISGDFADPSVIREGNTYYAVGTSSEWGPAYPMYTSKNLVDWEYLGPVFNELPTWTMGSYWAPELFYRNGTFFVYYTARRKSDKQSFIGVATTKDIRKGFIDHGLLLEWTKEAIDGFVVEDNGKLFLTWKAYGLDKGRGIEILGAELSNDGLKVIGKEFGLIKADANNWEGGGAEGQAIFKKGNYWYMLYSGNTCCGENCNYQVGIARAEKLQGPWTKFAENPILVGNETWKCPGHGTVVTTPDNRYFYLHHAYNGADFTSIGRQGVLSEMVWDETTKWPSFRYGKATPVKAESPMAGGAKTNQDLNVVFSNKTGDINWVYDVSFPKPEFRIEKGLLVIKNENKTATGNFLGVVMKGGNYDFSTEIIPQEGVSQHITVYGDANNAIGYGIINSKIILWEIKDGVYSTINTQELQQKPDSIVLKMQSRLGRFFEFSWNVKGIKADQTPLKIEGSWLPRWDRAPRVGINVSGEKPGYSAIRSIRLKYN